MKLVLCGHCRDIFNVTTEAKKCTCKRTKAKVPYKLSTEVDVTGPCLVIGIDNNELHSAIKRWIEGKDRAAFTAFIFVPQLGNAKFNALPEDLLNYEEGNPELTFIRRYLPNDWAPA